MATQYYMLISSLPHLPHFLAAERLPINPERLRWRRGMLDEQDAADLDMALDLLHWPRHPRTRTDAQIDAQFRRAMQQIRNNVVRGFVDEAMGQRSVLAGLRRKARRMREPAADDRCGVGDWDNLIRSRWERDDFGLTPRLPWLPQARALLAQGQASALEQLLMEVAWRRASQVAEADPFGFPAVFAYVVKWDILSRWLSRNPERAAARFKQMVDEVIHEQKQPSPGPRHGGA